MSFPTRWKESSGTSLARLNSKIVPIVLVITTFGAASRVAYCCILGIDFLNAFHGVINLGDKTLTLENNRIQLSLRQEEDVPQVRRVTLVKKVAVPPNTMKMVKGQVKCQPGVTLLVNTPHHVHKGGLIPFSLTSTSTDGSCEDKNRTVVVSVINDTDHFLYLKKGHIIGDAEEISDILKEEDQIQAKQDVQDENDEFRFKSDSNAASLRSELENEKNQPAFNVQQFSTSMPKVPDHLQDLWRKSCEHLDLEQSTILAETLTEYADVFSKDDLDLGCFSTVKHKIDTGTTKPIRQKMRRTPLGFENEEKDHLDSLLKINVIQPSASEWASPPVLVRKKDGKVRWCIDYRALNNATVKDAFPLPNISECLDVLENAKFFSTLDMISGYYQVDIEEEDRPKTAFITKYGLFEHRRMQFGLCNAPANFQRFHDVGPPRFNLERSPGLSG